MTGGYTSARDLRGPLELSCDVVVVGSGAGGAVVATELALAGERVIVLEEGPHVPAEQYGKMRQSESLRHLWRDGGTTLALPLGNTPAVNVTMGRCVGGSSVLTGGVCFRIPDHVLHVWRSEHHLDDLTDQQMEACYEAVERATHVEEVPVEMRSRSTVLFGEGLKKLGGELKPIRRNTKGCRGCGRCNFGCPEGAKMSVDLSYLPRAVAAGAEVFSHCLVTRVRIEGDRAVGVEGRILNRPGAKPGDRLVVHARRVVVACGAWHTPLLLGRSGVGRRSGVLGRRMTVHPAFKMIARFDSPVRGWQGALQSAYSDRFEAEGITLVSFFIPVGVIGATLPGVGPEHVRNAASIDHLALFGGVIHDEGGGSVHRGLGREPIVTYRMSATDRARVPRFVRILADAYSEAGALELFPPILGMRGLDPDAMRRLDLERIPLRRFECTSQHPLGTARMGASPERSVVDSHGQAWDVRGLFVADGSVVPTSLGVNPQLSIMSIATRIAWAMRDRKPD